jgi:hypothetical protein
VHTLEDPVPAEFAREFQASTVHVPLPEAFFERVVAESLKLPAHIWKRALDGLLAVDDAGGGITAPTLLIGGSGTSSSRGRRWRAWRRRSPAPGCSSTRRRAMRCSGSAPSGSPATWTPSCERERTAEEMGEHFRAGDLDIWTEQVGQGPDVLLIGGGATPSSPGSSGSTPSPTATA